MITVLAVIWLAAYGTLQVGGARAARHRAQSAADLSALAGAGALNGGEPPCDSAAAIARRNRSSLVDCVIQGQVVDVTVKVTHDVRTPFGSFSVEARARAGPVEPGVGAGASGVLDEGTTS